MPIADRETTCAVCGPGVGYTVRYPENLAEDDLNFAARRMPRRVRYRIVECARCGLVYSNPIYAPDTIETLYRDKSFHPDDQIENYCRDYLKQFDRAAAIAGDVSRVLEIGCANGYFLKALRARGISEVVGVEPSRNAAEQADDDVRDAIIVELFDETLFDENSFDVVCVFQTMDHLVDPATLARNAARVLRPGGVLLAINHNIRSWMPELLGRNCAMYDVQHIYLFDLMTMPRLMENAGLRCVHARAIANYYGLAYAVKMLPVLPAWLRSRIIATLEALGLGEFRVRVPGGNMAVIGQKPDAQS